MNKKSKLHSFLSVNNYKFDEYNVKLSVKIKNIYHNIII